MMIKCEQSELRVSETLAECELELPHLTYVLFSSF